MIEKFGIDTIIIILTIKITTITIIILRIFYNDQIHITNISINTKIKKNYLQLLWDQKTEITLFTIAYIKD